MTSKQIINVKGIGRDSSRRHPLGPGHCPVYECAPLFRGQLGSMSGNPTGGWKSYHPLGGFPTTGLKSYYWLEILLLVGNPTTDLKSYRLEILLLVGNPPGSLQTD